MYVKVWYMRLTHHSFASFLPHKPAGYIAHTTHFSIYLLRKQLTGLLERNTVWATDLPSRHAQERTRVSINEPPHTLTYPEHPTEFLHYPTSFSSWEARKSHWTCYPDYYLQYYNTHTHTEETHKIDHTMISMTTARYNNNIIAQKWFFIFAVWEVTTKQLFNNEISGNPN